MGCAKSPAAVVAAILAVLALAYVLGGGLRPRPKARSFMCLSNMEELGLAMTQQTAEYDGRFPPAVTWNDALLSELKNDSVFVCPQSPPNQKLPTYAMNRLMSGIRVQDVRDPKNVVLLLDSKPGRNRFGGPGMLPDPPRHNTGDNYAFADGHGKWFSRKSASTHGVLRWNPGPPAHPKSP